MYPFFTHRDQEMQLDNMAVLKPAIQYNLDQYNTSIVVLHSGRDGLPLQKAFQFYPSVLPNVVGFALLDVTFKQVELGVGSSIYYITSERLSSATNSGWSNIDGVKEPIIGMMTAIQNQETYPDQRFPTFWLRNPIDIQEIDLNIKADFNGILQPVALATNPCITFTLQLYHAITS
jgi:hypothetical protein